MFDILKEKLISISLGVVVLIAGYFVYDFYKQNKKLEKMLMKQELKIVSLKQENNNLKQTILKIKDSLKAVSFEKEILNKKLNVTRQIKGNKNEKNISINRDVNITVP